jgi:excisionase family DNA binding protein
MNKYLTVNEVAELLQIHWQTVLTYIKQGQLTALKLGKGYRISPEALDAFVKKHSTREDSR